MNSAEVVALYRVLDGHGVQVRIDGGWCVDALLGRQTRPHADLDVAVPRRDEPTLLDVLARRGYRPDPAAAATEGNYVLADGRGNRVDVHVYEFDASGAPRYGIAYPPASLTGAGVIAGVPVRCIAASWMFAFKTGYPPAAKDLADVRALAAAFGLDLPESHRGD